MPEEGLTPVQQALRLHSIFAADQLAGGASPVHIIEQLVVRGMSRTDAADVVNRVRQALEKDEAGKDKLASLIQRLLVSLAFLAVGLWVLLGADGDEDRFFAGLGLVALALFAVFYRLLRLFFR